MSAQVYAAIALPMLAAILGYVTAALVFTAARADADAKRLHRRHQRELAAALAPYSNVRPITPARPARNAEGR